ncbi:MAG: hypothetical protein ILP09_03885 [Oscillospiraceae bacterium]|nr:hypothetical protein [Oscillospiraceae bacterium]
MNRTVSFIKHEPMLCISLLAAAAGLIITPPSAAFLGGIDWRTLGNLLMMLCVLEGFKRERILRPVENLAKRLRSMFALSLFLIFGVFFTSMFVTNDVSLIIFVPLTISLFRSAGREKYILPVISMENIAAVRGSLLTPFGSPQNMFLYGQAREINFRSFAAHMSPLAAMSAVLLVLFVLVLYRKNLGEVIDFRFDGEEWKKDRRAQRAVYLILFALVILVIVTRTRLWWAALIAVAAAIFTADRSIFGKVDYVLVVTFLCFFIFSSSVAGNAGISAFLSRSVARR